MRSVFLIALLLQSLAAAFRTPQGNIYFAHQEATPLTNLGTRRQSPNVHAKQSLGGEFPLRVLLIGDSILVGYASLDFNGFRQHLYDNFVESGKNIHDEQILEFTLTLTFHIR